MCSDVVSCDVNYLLSLLQTIATDGYEAVRSLFLHQPTLDHCRIRLFLVFWPYVSHARRRLRLSSLFPPDDDHFFPAFWMLIPLESSLSFLSVNVLAAGTGRSFLYSRLKLPSHVINWNSFMLAIYFKHSSFPFSLRLYHLSLFPLFSRCFMLQGNNII